MVGVGEELEEVPGENEGQADGINGASLEMS
jgi:hypothetical protein